MGQGTEALKREGKRRLEKEGVKVIGITHANSGHLHFEVQLPNGSTTTLVSGCSPADVEDSTRCMIRTLRRYHLQRRGR